MTSGLVIVSVPAEAYVGSDTVSVLVQLLTEQGPSFTVVHAVAGAGLLVKRALTVTVLPPRTRLCNRTWPWFAVVAVPPAAGCPAPPPLCAPPAPPLL
jgi:hypothetical protein